MATLRANTVGRSLNADDADCRTLEAWHIDWISGVLRALPSLATRSRGATSCIWLSCLFSGRVTVLESYGAIQKSMAKSTRERWQFVLPFTVERVIVQRQALHLGLAPHADLIAPQIGSALESQARFHRFRCLVTPGSHLQRLDAWLTAAAAAALNRQTPRSGSIPSSAHTAYR
jgi:hypothetical protein